MSARRPTSTSVRRPRETHPTGSLPVTPRVTSLIRANRPVSSLVQVRLPFPRLHYLLSHSWLLDIILDECAFIRNLLSSCEGCFLQLAANARDAAKLDRDIYPLGIVSLSHSREIVSKDVYLGILAPRESARSLSKRDFPYELLPPG